MNKARYGNKQYQNAAYANHLNIVLGRAQGVREPLKIYIILMNCFVDKKVAVLSRYT